MKTEELIRSMTAEEYLLYKSLCYDWRTHPDFGKCAECGQDCRSLPTMDLVMTVEACRCGKPPFAHLVEQLHHKKCYRPKLTDL